MKKVVIGIVAKHIKTDRIRTDSLIRDEVKQAIFDNDAVAIGILSPNEEILYTSDNWKQYEVKLEKENIINQINLCDGIIIQGGSTNEAYENYISKYCYENDIPILGICAGQNSIVRALGGTTVLIDNPEKHYRCNDIYVHDIIVNKNSKFYSIVGKEKIVVNSRHKRTVDLCPNLNKVAFCQDNYADVIESKAKKFYIGLRFHPESLYKIDKNMNNIFKYFINVCKSRK